MATNTTTVKTMAQLQKLMPKILKEHGKDKKLSRAALSNPILALERIGYKLSAGLKEEVEIRARFGAKEQKKLAETQKKITKIAGKKVNLSSNTAVSKLLKGLIKTKNVKAEKKTDKSSALFKAVAINPESRLFKTKMAKDPLDDFRSSHPIIPLLLDYRRIEASAPKLASKKLFNEILKGKTPKSGIRIKNVKFVMQSRDKRKDRHSSS